LKSNDIIRSDCRQIQIGDDYLCLAKHVSLAEKLIFEARRKGARRCFSWHYINKPWHKQLRINSTHRNEFIDDYYQNHLPLNIIAITGTNGKTSTTCLLQRALELRGYSALLMGTIGMRFSTKDSWSYTGLTTADYADIRAALKMANQRSIPFMIMEASSHALAQRRLGSLSFFAVGSTTVTLDDHLEYHKTERHYLQSKAKLFTDYESAIKVLDYKNALLPYLPMLVTTYAPKQLKNCSLKTHLQSKNIQLAQEILSKANISTPIHLDHWVQSSLIKGRFEEFFWSSNRTVIVDFAHTPEALKYLLSGLAHIPFSHRWLIFGCGGQRDRSKRFEMVQVAKQYIDNIIITSDNPRHEPFDQIVADMCSAISRHDLMIIEDRAAAINYAHTHAPYGSLVVIAGKGHEESQVIGSRSIQYSDLKEAEQYVE